MKIKNLSDNALGNPIYKMSSSKIKISVKRARYSLVIGATLLAGLLPFSANAQVSEEKLEVSEEKIELLSEQDKVAQQQLSKENEETAKEFILTPDFTSPDFTSIDEPISKQINNGDSAQPQVSTIYSANPQIGPSRCVSTAFDNYGCYAIESQRGRNSFNATANSFTAPSALALNTQEANTLFFPNGDPPGTWLQAQHPNANGSLEKRAFNEFAIGAAKVMNDWRTPVFFDVEFGFGNSVNVVLESITFDSPFLNALSTLCSSYGFNDKQANVSRVASDCARATNINGTNPNVTVSSIDIAYWSRGGTGTLGRVDRTYRGSDLSGFIWNNFNQGFNNDYVWDPPQTVKAVPESSPTLGLLTFSLLSINSFITRKRK